MFCPWEYHGQAKIDGPCKIHPMLPVEASSRRENFFNFKESSDSHSYCELFFRCAASAVQCLSNTLALIAGSRGFEPRHSKGYVCLLPRFLRLRTRVMQVLVSIPEATTYYSNLRWAYNVLIRDTY